MFKKNTAVAVPFALVSATDGSAVTAATVTARVALDTGAQAAATGTVTELGNGQYRFDAAAADMNGDSVGLLFTATGAVPVHFTIRTTTKLVSELNDVAATDIVSAGAITTSGGAVSTVTSVTNGVTVTTNNDKTGYSISGTLTTLDGLNTQLATDHGAGSWATATGFSTHSAADVWSVATRTLTAATNIDSAIADAVWDEVITGAAHNTTNSAAKFLREAAESVAVRVSTAQGGTANTITLDANASSTNDAYTGMAVALIEGTSRGGWGVVTDYDGTTKVATIDRNWQAGNPAADTQFAISVAAVVLGSITHEGSVIPTVTDVTTKTGYKLASDGLDSISTTAPAGVASNFREMVVQTWRRLFKKSDLTSTQLKTYADDGTTVVTTQAVSDDGTTQTQGAAS